MGGPRDRARTVAARLAAVRKTYGRGASAVTALDGVTVDFPAGSFTAAYADSVLFLVDGRIVGHLTARAGATHDQSSSQAVRTA